MIDSLDIANFVSDEADLFARSDIDAQAVDSSTVKAGETPSVLTPSATGIDDDPGNSANGLSVEGLESKLQCTSAADPPTLLPAGPRQGGAGGGTGAPTGLTNREFLDEVFRAVPNGATAVVCSKSNDPSSGGWRAKRVSESSGIDYWELNNFFNCSSFYPDEDGITKAQQQQFAACHTLLFDDIGTKVPWERVKDFRFSWILETSPGNHQAGIIFAQPLTDLAQAKSLLDAVIDAEYCDAGANGAGTRWMRLPVGINGKPKYISTEGKPFQCRLVEFHPERRYTVDEVLKGLKLDLTPQSDKVLAKRPAGSKPLSDLDSSNGIYLPAAAENPVITALKKEGLYKRLLSAGKHDITCPWVVEHTDAADNGAAYFEPSSAYPMGGFKCQHSHGSDYRITKLVDRLGLTVAKARNRPMITVVNGELNRVVGMAELVLANGGKHYQAGGLIVSVATDPATGDARIVPAKVASLAMELSAATDWEKWDGRAQKMAPCDPPARHLQTLYDLPNYAHLPPLTALSRQPYFREADGSLVKDAGYDAKSKMFGVFDPAEFVFPEPNDRAAREALEVLNDLFAGFHFETEMDRSAAMAAVFTAAMRPTFPNAPGFHVRAPSIGSGKSYLCDLIGAFAGPGPNRKVSYPRTSEEATKMMMALLIENVSVVDFDDMEGDWYAHGIIKRIFTAEAVTDRLLGGNKSPTVSTRTTFLGSSNNGGPVQDLLRRVLTIRLDPQTATPAMMKYATKPLERVRQERGRHVSAVLTIAQAWRNAGCPRQGENIASYGGIWSDYCRYPLIWLGMSDPAVRLFEQITHDPELDDLGVFMGEWQKAFQARATTVRKAVEVINANTAFLDALCELRGVVEGDKINRTKFGYFLKRNENRVVRGMKFRKTRADGRTAWELVPAQTSRGVAPPLSPPATPSVDPEAEKVDPDFIEF